MEIVILAAVAAFLGLRLYSVLGQRAEHEEEGQFASHFDRGEQGKDQESVEQAAETRPQVQLRETGLIGATETGVRAIAAADPGFDVMSFLDGAKGAYAMVLEAFWAGDRDTLRELCDEDVYASFAAAIDAREAAGETTDNKLIRIEDTTIMGAELDGRMARVTVLFVADIAAVTRDKDGTVVAGSLDDAIESRDIWTFMRNVDSSGPDWTLDETDEG